jgi:hypothetical protein
VGEVVSEPIYSAQAKITVFLRYEVPIVGLFDEKELIFLDFDVLASRPQDVSAAIAQGLREYADKWDLKRMLTSE